LVVGSSGFVGTWLVEYLRSVDDEVFTLAKGTDLRDLDSLRGEVADLHVDAVYHLAAQSHVGRSWSNPEETYMINVMGTANLCSVIRSMPIPPKLLFVSSSEVYGKVSQGDLPLKESHELAPVSPYAASKVAAEEVVKQLFYGSSIPVVVARAFNHIGPGQDEAFVASALAKRLVSAKMKGDKEIRVGNLKARRDFTDVRDVVRAYRMLIEKADTFAVYNLCSGASLSVEQLAQLMIDELQVDLQLTVSPELVRPVDTFEVVGSNFKLRSTTGWVPEFDLYRTIRDLLAYWTGRLITS
jgi:GDP-4-dehydro-6-deoxy-D-mannose reductase